MSRSVAKLLRDLSAPQPGGPAPARPALDPDYRLWPQGWSLAMIEREEARRYRAQRDVERAQDWVWAVDEPAVRAQMSAAAHRAAHAFYGHRQRAAGDVERPDDMSGPRGFWYLGASWAQERSAAIAANAESYVRRHPEASPARLKLFTRLFAAEQPPLETLRWEDGVRRSHRETARRIAWCCETLADCEAGLNAGYGPG